MPKLRAALCLLPALVCLFAATAQAEETALFEAAAADWLSPKAAAMAAGTYELHTGDSAYAPPVAPEVTPYDEETVLPPAAGYTFETSDSQIVSVDAQGLMTGVSDGTATVTCVKDGKSDAFTVTVSADALPERVKAYVYVARREYLKNMRQYLPRANEYTKWYYRRAKEVGWCAVFTIWCANAVGL